ncbi:hypothetical protein [Melioribacter sp. OK-6-Me]|uniref:hypothetical protein n=1 Tax=unclassified Melioribacter TaxID=2627329 RepID=UPI003ED8CA4C
MKKLFIFIAFFPFLLSAQDIKIGFGADYLTNPEITSFNIGLLKSNYGILTSVGYGKKDDTGYGDYKLTATSIKLLYAEKLFNLNAGAMLLNDEGFSSIKDGLKFTGGFGLNFTTEKALYMLTVNFLVLHNKKYTFGYGLGLSAWF